MTALRRHFYTTIVAPVAAPMAPGQHHSAGNGFATLLQAAMQEVEGPEDVTRVEPTLRAKPLRSDFGQHIVAGIVIPAPLPR